MRFLVPFAAVLIIGGSASAESTQRDAAAPEEARDPEQKPAPSLGIDRLLRVPVGPAAPQQVRGGHTREVWEERFSEARLEITELELRIQRTQDDLRAKAGGEWSYSPTGGATASDPEVLKLRSVLRRDRQSLEAAKKRLHDLSIDASLAGVPDEWIEVEASGAGGP
jgi:hypothetical protein